MMLLARQPRLDKRSTRGLVLLLQSVSSPVNARQVVRVGIEFPFFGESWLGGVAAIANLVNAVSTMESPRIEPVLVAGVRTPDSLLKEMEGVTTLRTNLVDASHWSNWVGRASRRVLGRNLLMERWLTRHGIDVYSHCAPLGRGSAIPTIGQIADFGYKHFPELYDPAARARTDKGTARICNEYDFLLLLSRSAEEDYRRFFPNASAKSVVLNILPSNIPDQNSTRQQLEDKYRIPRRYFYSPNQFWVHKNHHAIVEALAIAENWGRRLDVVCSGLPLDPRRPDHFELLIRRAEQLGVRDRFHVLGIIPYQDVVDLMRHSVAVLSASLFEGWGISVAEANLLGKALVISDIPTFREQAPARVRYFDPRDPESLARELIAADEGYSEEKDISARALQKDRWPQMVKRYAMDYEGIVLAAATGSRA